MKNYPLLDINLDKIQANTRAVVEICSTRGISVTGIVKGVCGSPKVARAMLQGGVQQIGDSRIANLERLRDNGILCSLLMLRIPMLSQTQEIVRLCDCSLNSELKVIENLSDEALKIGRSHKVILMVDVGDLREGVAPGDAPYLAERIMELEGIELEGIGTNLSCYGGIIPTEKNMGVLADTAFRIEERIGRKLKTISGGNSSGIELIISGKMPPKINHMRIGEGILLGQETIACQPIPGTRRDAFIFKAEIIEQGRKPSCPSGEIARDAFGNKPDFKDRGIRKRAILGAGRQDIMVQGLKPELDRASILGASSDHLIVDIEDCAETLKVGNPMSFRLEYGALLSAMTSEYVFKKFSRETKNPPKKSISIISAPSSTGANMKGAELAPASLLKQGLAGKIEELGYATLNPNETLGTECFDANADYDKKIRNIIGFNSVLSGLVRQSIDKGAFPLVIGGDHTVSIGVLNGLKLAGLKNIGMLLFGAFADFNTAETTRTRNPHGTTLAACAGLERLFGFEGIGQENIVAIGVRQVDKGERELLRNSRVNLFTMERIDLIGMREAISQGLEMLGHCSDGIHVSLSMDAISPEYAPGVSTPSEGGLSLREAHLAMELLSKSNLTVSMDIVELTPTLDQGEKTARLATNLICSLLGKRVI